MGDVAAIGQREFGQSEVVLVAGELTAAQKRAMLEASDLDGRLAIRIRYLSGIRVASPTLRRLRALGLTEAYPAFLLPFGLLVREHLEGGR